MNSCYYYNYIFWKVLNKPAFNVASSLVIIFEMRFKICVKSYVFHFKPCTWFNFQSCLIAQITIENWSLHRLCLGWSLFGYLELWPQWHYLNNSTIFIRKWNLEINYCMCFSQKLASCQLLQSYPSRNYHRQCRKLCNNCLSVFSKNLTECLFKKSLFKSKYCNKIPAPLLLLLWTSLQQHQGCDWRWTKRVHLPRMNCEEKRVWSFDQPKRIVL